MKKIFYPFLFIVFSLGIWLLTDYDFSPKAGSEIEKIENSPFSDAILIRNADIEDVFLYLVFPSGEASNTFDEGLAHYVEHLAWLSAFGGDQNERMRHSNAWTNHFSTGYWQKAVDDDLHHSLRTLLSVSSPLNVETDFVLEERNIVLREYDYRVAERPLYPVFRDMDRVLYGDGALARSVIGEPEAIAEYSLEAATSLHKQSHALSNATLLVYGNVSKARLEAAIKSLSVEGLRITPERPVSFHLVENGIAQDRGTISPLGLSEEAFIYRKLVPLNMCNTTVSCIMLAQLAENALGSSLPGGLAGPLRYNQFIARRFSFNITVIGSEYIEISFIGHPDAGVSLEELEDEFHTAFRRTIQDGLPQETFNRITSRLAGQFDQVLERDRPSYNRDLVLNQLMSARQIFTLYDQVNGVESILLKDVNEFLKSLLVDGREVTRLVNVVR